MAAGFSAESCRTTAYSCDMRWDIDMRWLGYTLEDDLSGMGVSRTVARFEATGAQSKIIKPSMYLHEIQRWKQLGHKLMYVG